MVVNRKHSLRRRKGQFASFEVSGDETRRGQSGSSLETEDDFVSSTRGLRREVLPRSLSGLSGFVAGSIGAATEAPAELYLGRNVQNAVNAPDGSAAQCTSPYKPLDLNEIRLIEILPGILEDSIELIIRTVDLGTQPQYEALSYVWKPQDGSIDPTRIPKSVTIKSLNGVAIPISANLDVALRHLRNEHHARTLWIDAICINQEDSTERNQQVSLMGKIYSLAKQVLVWLGPSSAGWNDSDFAMDTIASGDLRENDLTKLLHGLENLLSRDWFTRVWTVQELVLAHHDPVIICGSRSLNWTIFLSAIGLVRDRIVGLQSTHSVSYPAAFQYLQYETIIKSDYWRMSRQSLWSQTPKPLVVLAGRMEHLAEIRRAGVLTEFPKQLRHTIYLQASDSRDRVFGLLGISVFKKRTIVPDYSKSEEEVYGEATAIVAKDNLSVYLDLLSRTHLAVKKSKTERMAPSWMLDLQLISKNLFTSDRTIVPQDETIEQLLNRAHLATPLVHCSLKLGYMRTVGQTWGKIQIAVRLGSQSLQTLGTSLRQHDITVDPDQLLSTLLGPSNPNIFDRQEMLYVLRVCLQEDTSATTVDFFESKDFLRFENALNYYRPVRHIFVTDTGLTGLAPGVRPNTVSCHLVGLFGINIPFVLRLAESRSPTSYENASKPPVTCDLERLRMLEDDDQYGEADQRYVPERVAKMVGDAFVADHHWGHEFMEDAEPGTDWRDFVRDGLLEEFVIV